MGSRASERVSEDEYTRIKEEGGGRVRRDRMK